jgi:hypothetical protein
VEPFAFAGDGPGLDGRLAAVSGAEAALATAFTGIVTAARRAG